MIEFLLKMFYIKMCFYMVYFDLKEMVFWKESIDI